VNLLSPENEYKKRTPTYKSETPTAISGQAYTGPLALLNFVVNETASFFSIFFSSDFNLEKELNK
jgi:hypothetical protein